MERSVLGGRYELGPAIGAGGFGTVFRARDRASGLEVAVKLVLPGLGSEAAAHRLRRESEILRRVVSRHVARVYDGGDDEGAVWLVTELVDGGHLTLATLGRALLPHEVLRVARGLLSGLAAIHGAGVVHGDIKPSNLLVPRGGGDLSVKIVDFGLARIMTRADVAASLGEAAPGSVDEGVFGTARFMAPELLQGGEPSPRSDLYAAGLVLFDLLDEGPLFPVGDRRAQLRARLTGDPYLEERVPEPLDDVFARLLAREPTRRYVDGSAAHEAVVDLDTAPVSSSMEETAVGPIVRPSAVPSFLRSATESRSTAPPSPGSRSPVGPSSVPPPPRTFGLVASASAPAPAPPSGTPTAPPRSVAPSARPRPDDPKISVLPEPARPPPSIRPPLTAPWQSIEAPTLVARLTNLPLDGIVALRETLRHLDLPMLDALARRERGNVVGRIARAVALALRLELDAAALILEPLAMQSEVARAIGAAVVAPRARRATRARVDTDREDRWIDAIDTDLAAMLVALAASLGSIEDAERDLDRCNRMLARLESAGATFDVTRALVRVAQAAVQVRRGEIDRQAALDVIAPVSADGRPELPFHLVVSALSAAALFSGSGNGIQPATSQESGRIGAELERAERIAAETGTTLLDASAATALGMLLVTLHARDENGLRALERAGTLLAHSDAPSLEHQAEHHRALALVALGRWGDAVVHLRAAREAAHAERAGEIELVSTALEVIAQLAVGDARAADEAALVLSEARLAGAQPRTAVFGWIARGLVALVGSDDGPTQEALREASLRLRGLGAEVVDAHVLVEGMGALLGGSPDVPRLERLVVDGERGGIPWLDVLRAVVARVPDDETRSRMDGTLDALDRSLYPKPRLEPQGGS